MVTRNSIRQNRERIFVLRKRKTIKVGGMKSRDCENNINDVLSELEGVKHVETDSVSGRVFLEYDLIKIRLVDIETRIIDAGYQLPENFFSRTYKKIIHFTEENEYGCALIKHASSVDCGGCSLKNKCGL